MLKILKLSLFEDPKSYWLTLIKLQILLALNKIFMVVVPLKLWVTDRLWLLVYVLEI